MQPLSPQSSPVRERSSLPAAHTFASSPIRRVAGRERRRKYLPDAKRPGTTSRRLETLRAAYTKYLTLSGKPVPTVSSSRPPATALSSAQPLNSTSPSSPVADRQFIKPSLATAPKPNIRKSPPVLGGSPEWSTLPRSRKPNCTTSIQHFKKSGRFRIPLLVSSAKANNMSTASTSKPRVVTYLPPPPTDYSREPHVAGVESRFTPVAGRGASIYGVNLELGYQPSPTSPTCLSASRGLATAGFNSDGSTAQVRAHILRVSFALGYIYYNLEPKCYAAV